MDELLDDYNEKNKKVDKSKPHIYVKGSDLSKVILLLEKNGIEHTTEEESASNNSIIYFSKGDEHIAQKIVDDYSEKERLKFLKLKEGETSFLKIIGWFVLILVLIIIILANSGSFYPV